jgi:ABC-type polysaccharide/polyol phosphate transport system ATPase subunit
VTLPAIHLEQLGKRYWQLEEQAMLLKSLLPFARSKRHELWALRDVDLSIYPGETVGVLGRNGAGKTTLLRLLAGVSQPTSGRITINGRVAPLIGVGVGFHPEMSGRENVYVNGMLLGLTKAQVEERFDDIVAFSELEEFIDTPVKFYSSGMFMRLGFAVAVHVEPQILLVDEILAVGDISFQRKCADRMRELQELGTTVLLVSHSMHAIRLLCPRALLFRRGELLLDSDAESVIGEHHRILTSERVVEHGISEAVTIVEHVIVDDKGRPIHATEQDVELTAKIRLRFETDFDSPQLHFRVLSDDGQLTYNMQTDIGRAHRAYRAGEEASVTVTFHPRFGGGGTFRTGLVVLDKEGRDVVLVDNDGPDFYLPPRLGVDGVADLGADISIDGHLMSDHRPLLMAGRAKPKPKAEPKPKPKRAPAAKKRAAPIRAQKS